VHSICPPLKDFLTTPILIPSAKSSITIVPRLQTNNQSTSSFQSTPKRTRAQSSLSEEEVCASNFPIAVEVESAGAKVLIINLVRMFIDKLIFAFTLRLL
jgi:hypothetical protein